MDVLTAKVNRELIKYAVMRAIFCPYTGEVLDMRRAVLVQPNHGSASVCTAAFWDAHSQTVRDGIQQAKDEGKLPADYEIEILDGRDYYTPSGRPRAAS